MTAIFIKTKNVTGVGSPKQASEGADPDLQIKRGMGWGAVIQTLR